MDPLGHQPLLDKNMLLIQTWEKLVTIDHIQVPNIDFESTKHAFTSIPVDKSFPEQTTQ